MATLIVVRRGASETFHHLQGTWAPKLGGDLTIIWDRRTSDRRRAVEQRVGERRQANAEWLDGFREARHTERRRQPELRMPEAEQRVGERRQANAEWLDGFREARHTERRQQPELRMPEPRRVAERRAADAQWLDGFREARHTERRQDRKSVV